MLNSYVTIFKVNWKPSWGNPDLIEARMKTEYGDMYCDTLKYNVRAYIMNMIISLAKW